jgi:hypothetical protein
MLKVNILVSVLTGCLLMACNHDANETNEPDFSFTLSRLSCVEGDTIDINVWVDGALYTGDVHWNASAIERIGQHHIFIAPRIFSDSSLITLAAQFDGKTASQQVLVQKKALLAPSVSFGQTIQPLLAGNCNFSGCHGNGSRAGNVVLSIYDSVRLTVMPFNAHASLLYIALIKTDPLRVMPPAGQLHDYLIEDVRLWIEQGAQNN